MASSTQNVLLNIQAVSYWNGNTAEKLANPCLDFTKHAPPKVTHYLKTSVLLNVSKIVWRINFSVSGIREELP